MVASLQYYARTFLFLISSIWLSPVHAQLTSDKLAIVVNDLDPSSELVAAYYQSAYQLPASSLIHVVLDHNKPTLSQAEFSTLKINIESQLLPQHRAVLFVWTNPFRVACQSITSAYTLGFDPNICAKTCGPSQASPYYNLADANVDSATDIRLSMLLPSQDIDLATKVVDNGLLSQQGVFKSTAYYVTTNDQARSSRAKFFPKDGLSFSQTGLSVRNIKAEALYNKEDVMIYQTGAVNVAGLPTLNFLPGALADHLTSVGGDLHGRSQMNVLAWLDAGATASYGTVTEPCNYWQKFPNASALLRWYIQGDTAIEAYWKSVAWPSQGLFVGDPLAAPYANAH